MMLITYDISIQEPAGAKRLRKIAKACLDYGVRVQNSVFECEVDPSQWEKLKSNLLKILDEKHDSLRFYKLGANWKPKVEHHGIKEAPDIFRDALII